MQVQLLHLEVPLMGKDLGKVLEVLMAPVLEAAQTKVNQYLVSSAGSGTMVVVPLERAANAGMCARFVLSQESLENSIRPLHMTPVPNPSLRSVFSTNFNNISSVSRESWSINNFIHVHNIVRQSNMYNFEGCKIPIPTSIRYDRIREALGNQTTPKEDRVLGLLEFGMFGMPIVDE